METSHHLHLYDGSHRTAGQRFRFTYDDDRWVWSPWVEQMHGYRPGTIAPSTMLVLSHVHPNDVGKVATALNGVRHTHRPFSSFHRIVDTNSHVHEVVMVGAPFYDTHGTLLGLQGFYLGLAPATTTDGREQATQRLRAVAARGHTEEWRQRIRAATRC